MLKYDKILRVLGLLVLAKFSFSFPPTQGTADASLVMFPDSFNSQFAFKII